ncbi:hypothetical protein RQN30_08500 [Arcanobacterium hippocoleae]
MVFGVCVMLGVCVLFGVCVVFEVRAVIFARFQGRPASLLKGV